MYFLENNLGDELDDRPPPTAIHVAPFREDSPEFMAFGTHAQRAAVISAGIGLSLVIFIFLSVFFEFDWYHHEKGVDIGALSEFSTIQLFLVFQLLFALMPVNFGWSFTILACWDVYSLACCAWNKTWAAALPRPLHNSVHHDALG
ncbi:hypothetical protein Y032_0004g1919 [Ancylostoma ceylanicum]|uniref:Uncharacterized protein n=1 Tax=Ancylostoma ceylanicum TaxID=53326 RepID=A0A016VUK2_9BILA|nr:hypothetical protein Y032_0004g1919 [Ancylostoma ceylanicum]